MFRSQCSLSFFQISEISISNQKSKQKMEQGQHNPSPLTPSVLPRSFSVACGGEFTAVINGTAPIPLSPIWFLFYFIHTQRDLWQTDSSYIHTPPRFYFNNIHNITYYYYYILYISPSPGFVVCSPSPRTCTPVIVWWREVWFKFISARMGHHEGGPATHRPHLPLPLHYPG